MRHRSFVIVALVVSLALEMGCGSSNKSASAPCKVETGAKTGVEGAKTGVETGVAGVKAAGGAVGGFVEGGSDEAKANWKEGKRDTKQTAHEGGQATKAEAHSHQCK